MARSYLTSSLGLLGFLALASRAGAAVCVDVTLTRSPSAETINPTEVVIYQIDVTNCGADTVDAVTVWDTVSPVLSVVQTAEPGGFTLTKTDTASGSLYIWSGTDLSLYPLQKFQFTISGTAGVICGTLIENSVSVSAFAGPSGTTLVATCSNFTVAAPDASVTLLVTTSSAEVPVGGELSYRIVAGNPASAFAPFIDITVVDTVSPLLTNVRTEQPTGFGAPDVTQQPGSGTRYIWSGSGLSVAPGTALTFTITGIVGEISATVTIGNSASAVVGNLCDSEAATAVAGPASLYNYLRGQGTPVAVPDSSHPRAVRLTWMPALESADSYKLTAYRIYRSDDGGGTTSFVVSVPCPNFACDHSIIDIVPQYGKRYVYIVHPVDDRGNVGFAYPLAIIDIILPSNRLFLDHNSFRPDRGQFLSIYFQITQPGRVRISVMTPTGALIKELYDWEHYEWAFTPDVPFYSRYQGLPAIVWDGANTGGSRIASGIYLIVLEIGDERDIRTVAVIR